MNNIVLFGFMGTGKSVVGKILSQKLNYDLIEMDHIIESDEGQSINKIFEIKGEAYFRSLEFKLAEKISNFSFKIISTGGGVVLNEKNIENLCKNGFGVCLNADASTICQRIQNDKTRPLVNTDKKNIKQKINKISKLLNERKSMYQRIPYQINTDDLDPNLIADKIILEYKK